MTDINAWLAEAAAVVHYGVAASARALPGEFDRNFELTTPDGAAYVLKYAHPQTPDAQLDFENAILARLAGEPVPQVLPVRGGGLTARTPTGKRVRLFSRLPGRPLAELPARPLRLAEDLGRLLGRIDRLLAGFEHPAMRRDWLWDLTQAPVQIRAGLDAVQPEDLPLVRFWLDRFEERAAPQLADLPAQVIHNDANDHNVLVEEAGGRLAISGLVDFGDALYAPRICEPAIAAAYAMFGSPDPLSAAASVLRGYRSEIALETQEIDVFWDLVGTRLAVSVCIAARRLREGSGNAYHQASAAPAREALARLAEVDPEAVRLSLLREA